MAKNYLTVDVEEFFEEVPRGSTLKMASRLEGQLEKCLSLLAATSSKATFFFLARRIEKLPHLVRNVADAGHEIASHGCDHEFLYKFPPEYQVAQVSDSKKILEDISGTPILGFRAPYFSIISKNADLLGIIAEAGYAYDSSVFPVSHPRYGWPHASVTPYMIQIDEDHTLLEIPPSTIDFMCWRIGLGGGAYLRILPQAFTMNALKRISAANRPLVLYFHPWELDPKQPRLALGASFAIRHYSCLSRTEERMDRILRAFPFTNCAEALSESYEQIPFAELSKID